MTERERLIELMKKAEDYSVNRLITDYEEAIENEADYLLANGVIVPQCRVGDMVYVEYYDEIVNAYVTEFEINSKGIVAKVYIDPDTYREYDIEDIHLTEAKAEQALKGGAE